MVGAEGILRRHGQALGGAHRGAQPTEAALGHVNIERRGINSLGSAIGGFSKLLWRADGLDGNAVDGTDLNTLVTYNTVLHFIVQFVSTVFRYRKCFVRKRCGGDSLLMVEVLIAGDVQSRGCRTSFGGTHHMSGGKRHSFIDRTNGKK